jgi:hypothetical protein
LGTPIDLERLGIDSDGVEHAFFDQAGTFTTIDDPNANGQGTAAEDVNNLGAVVGFYVPKPGVELGFELSPGR